MTDHDAILHLFERWNASDDHTMGNLAIAGAMQQIRWAAFLAGFRCAEQHRTAMDAELAKAVKRDQSTAPGDG